MRPKRCCLRPGNERRCDFGCEFESRAKNAAVGLFLKFWRQTINPLLHLQCNFFSTFRMHEKPLSKSEGLFIFRQPAKTRGYKFPLPLCFSNTKGCALLRVLLCLHLCGLERNNGVVLQKTSIPLPALLFKAAVVKSSVNGRHLL